MTELPRGWISTKVGEVTDIKLGKMLDSAKNKGVPRAYLRNINVRWGSFNLNDILEMRFTEDEFEAFGIKRGDLIVCEGGEPGRCAVWQGLDSGLQFQKALMRLRPLAGVSPFFMQSALRRLSLSGELDRHFTGTTIKHLPQSSLAAVPIPLPPLAEQKRIVAKLDALSAKSTRARTELARIETLVSRYKQAVLDAAFNTANGTVPLESLVDGFRGIPYGIVKTGDPYPSGVPTIRCGDIKAYRVEKKNLKLVDPKIAELYKRTSLRGGEVLIAIRGSIGETCVVGSELSGANISREVAMIPVSKALNPQFAMYFLKSKAAIEFIGINTKGSAQRGINLGDLRKLPIPTVPIQSQNEIVRRIETAFARIDRLAAEAKRALTLVGKLDEAILAKAFRGELVPQDENDEPASVLLERIRAERAAEPKPKRGRGAKPLPAS